MNAPCDSGGALSSALASARWTMAYGLSVAGAQHAVEIFGGDRSWIFVGEASGQFDELEARSITELVSGVGGPANSGDLGEQVAELVVESFWRKRHEMEPACRVERN